MHIIAYIYIYTRTHTHIIYIYICTLYSILKNRCTYGELVHSNQLPGKAPQSWNTWPGISQISMNFQPWPWKIFWTSRVYPCGPFGWHPKVRCAGVIFDLCGSTRAQLVVSRIWFPPEYWDGWHNALDTHTHMHMHIHCFTYPVRAHMHFCAYYTCEYIYIAIYIYVCRYAHIAHLAYIGIYWYTYMPLPSKGACHSTASGRGIRLATQWGILVPCSENGNNLRPLLKHSKIIWIWWLENGGFEMDKIPSLLRSLGPRSPRNPRRLPQARHHASEGLPPDNLIQVAGRPSFVSANMGCKETRWGSRCKSCKSCKYGSRFFKYGSRFLSFG